ncbi:thioredoxin [Patescibacteria group bacterium]|nr:thioredoxin [Patescibacteria group bacterium]
MDVTKSNFEQEVLKSETPVIVDFWAAWCGPCRAISPVVEELGKEYAGKAKVVKINVDEENELAMQFGIMSIPTLKFFKGGKIVGEIIGAAPKPNIVAELQKHL